MDKDRDDVLKELNVSHHKITSFLKDVYGEWNHYKNAVHNLKSKFSHLLNEYERVCNENKSLNKKNEKLNVLILNCIHFISDIDYSETSSGEFLKFALESIKQNFINEVTFKENLIVSSHSIVEDCEPKKNSSRRPLLDAEGTKNECKDGNLILMKNKFECPMVRMGKFVQSKEQSCYKNSLWSQKNVNVVNDNDERCTLTEDAKNERKEGALEEALEGAQSENFSLNFADMLVSPMKRGWSERETEDSTKKSDGYFSKKWKRKAANTSCRSPGSAAKKNVSKEDAGGKKMTQTLLNIDLFKVKTPVKDKVSDVDPPSSSKVPTEDGDGDEDEDDLIWESPRSTARKDRIRGDGPRLEPVSLSSEVAMDLDETYAPPELVETVEKGKGRRPRSPEYDCVPFIYRRDGRVKSSCSDCDLERNKGPLAHDSEKFNITPSSVFYCSKHRKKTDSKPELEDTPPGYWKPFLTNSIICSPTDDDA